MRARELQRLIGEAPVTLPLLAAVALFVGWASDQGGYPVTTWAPGTLGLLALLAIAATVIPTLMAGVPLPVRIAAVSLAAYTAWSFLSILWADDRGAAWEGSDRTLIYLIVFTLFALWRQTARTGAVVAGAWALGMAGLGVTVALRLGGGSALADLFVGDRLASPAGYPNAAAALWLMPVWPALALATARPVSWFVRGLLAGGAVVLCDLGLMAVSRGALLATPIVAVLVFAALPDRVRRMVVLAPIAAGVAAGVPALLRVGDRIDAGRGVGGALSSASYVILLAGLVVALVVAAGAWVETHRPVSGAVADQIHRGLGTLALAGIAVAVVGVVAVGHPVRRLDDAWHSFKGGYAEVGKGSSRLTSGLGSNRYDFYRVDVELFRAHPLVGIGADNFAQDYLVDGRSTETPRYPHSIELRTLVQTGLVGALLLGAALGAAVLAALRAARGTDALTRAVAGGALAAFAYFVVHGSADWFWEFVGLGAPAWAMLGLACALGERAPEPYLGRAPALSAPWSLVAGSVVAIAVLVSIGAPYLSTREVDVAARTWPASPSRAFAHLDHAASLNPLSDRPKLIAGSIALRVNDLARADRDFTEALSRNPRGAYGTLELGAIASTRGDGARARTLLRRAVLLNPRDVLARRALALVQKGETVDVTRLNEAILAGAAPLAGSVPPG